MTDNAPNSLVETPEALAVKEELLAEIRKTKLGRFLLDDLERRKVTLVLSGDMSAASEGNGSAAAYWDPQHRRIVLSPGAPMAKLLHFFAHETRHSAQFDVDMALARPTEVLHPVNFVLANRLQEMDADAFAVFFLANHAMETNSEFFSELSRPEKTSGWLSAAFGQADAKVDRSQMFRSFYDSWHESGRDPARAMRDAAITLFDDPLINAYYDGRCVALWNDKIYAGMVAASKDPDSKQAQSFKEVFKAFRDGKFQPPAERLEVHATAYSKIFAEAGSPDYLAGVTDKVYHFLGEVAVGAEHIWSEEMPAMKDHFNEACDYYCDRLGKKKPAAPRKSRTQAPKKAA